MCEDKAACVIVHVVYPYDARLAHELTVRPGDLLEVSRSEWNSGKEWIVGEYIGKVHKDDASAEELVKHFSFGGVTSLVSDHDDNVAQVECDRRKDVFRQFLVEHTINEPSPPGCDASEEPPSEKPIGTEITFKGKDYIVAEAVENWFQCIICHELADEPRVTTCCAKTICTDCNQKCQRGFSRNYQCPSCRQVDYRSTEDPRARQRILTLMTYCSNAECQWKGFLKDLDSHISKECPFEKVLCQQCRRVKSLRSVIETHMKNDCKKRPVKCPRCGIEEEDDGEDDFVPVLTHSTLVNEHYKTCPKWPMRCSNRCDPQLTFTRDGLQHLASDTECPEKEIDCQFASVAMGCKEKRKLRYMDEHIQETTAEHLTLLMGDYLRLKKAHSTLERSHSTLEKSHSTLEKAHSTLEKAHSTLQYNYDRLKEKEKVTKQESDHMVKITLQKWHTET